MNQSFTQMLVNYAPLLILFFVGWFFGARHERQHLARLAVSEKALAGIIVSTERFYRPTLAANSDGGELVLGSVVIAQDYFKMVVARVLNIFGRNLTTYETLLDRARREAVVRMRTQAQAKGYNHIYGLRFEVSNINQLGSMVEAIAYGTAVISVDNPK